jgi:hypothetical protein
MAGRHRSHQIKRLLEKKGKALSQKTSGRIGGPC